jgi:hypothetical protein
MKKLNNKGFSAAEVLIAVVILVLVGAIGWYVMARRNKPATNQTTPQASINSFEDCKKAGYPIQESYPETCKTPDGKSFTNPAQPAKPADETQTWLLYTPPKKTYSVRLPDGWKFVNLEESIYARGATDVVYAKGTKATVTTAAGGWDGPSDFSIAVPYDTSEIEHEGTEQGTITTNSGLIAHKFYYLQTAEPEVIGYAKGSKVYTYYFDAKGKYIQAQHVVTPGQTEQLALVEKTLKTLEVN